MHYASTMGKARLKHTTVIRYAVDGGYSPREWQQALKEADFDEPITDGQTHRVGVQITKTRTIDVIVRIEFVNGVLGSIAATFGRTKSDALFKNPKRCRKKVSGAGRPLALLSGRFGARSARVLICKARS
jgi:hypothetical protein